MVRIYQNKIIVLSITIFLKYINGIAVLRSRKPLQSTNFAEINDSSLNGLDRFTICARFFPYQFQDSFHYMQDIISTGSKETTLFGSVTTGDCNKAKGYRGCSEFLKNNIGQCLPIFPFMAIEIWEGIWKIQ